MHCPATASALRALSLVFLLCTVRAAPTGGIPTRHISNDQSSSVLITTDQNGKAITYGGCLGKVISIEDFPEACRNNNLEIRTDNFPRSSSDGDGFLRPDPALCRALAPKKMIGEDLNDWVVHCSTGKSSGTTQAAKRDNSATLQSDDAGSNKILGLSGTGSSPLPCGADAGLSLQNCVRKRNGAKFARQHEQSGPSGSDNRGPTSELAKPKPDWDDKLIVDELRNGSMRMGPRNADPSPTPAPESPSFDDFDDIELKKIKKGAND